MSRILSAEEMEKEEQVLRERHVARMAEIEAEYSALERRIESVHVKLDKLGAPR